MEYFNFWMMKRMQFSCSVFLWLFPFSDIKCCEIWTLSYFSLKLSPIPPNYLTSSFAILTRFLFLPQLTSYLYTPYQHRHCHQTSRTHQQCETLSEHKRASYSINTISYKFNCVILITSIWGKWPYPPPPHFSEALEKSQKLWGLDCKSSSSIYAKHFYLYHLELLESQSLSMNDFWTL